MRGIIILDFGSQYTQLIARRIRELGVYSEILPYNHPGKDIMHKNPYGLILSGGPASVYKEGYKPHPLIWKLGIPILGICYGHQLIAWIFKGRVKKAEKREYGPAFFEIKRKDPLFDGVPERIKVWMSHGDLVKKLPPGFISLGKTETLDKAAIKKGKIYGVQFHPEVIHTAYGKKILSNFVFKICDAEKNWSLTKLAEKKIEEIRKRVKDEERVICGVSGGVDSAVTAVLVAKAVGNRVYPLFINNGLLRENERKEVETALKKLIPLRTIDASKIFLEKLKGVKDPEEKRKIIGETFIQIFEEHAKKIGNVRFLAQGTLYPDVIESGVSRGPAAKIKSHHNVGGLPEKMRFELIEPLRELFKDEVRKLGKILKIPENFLKRHPFPGPGLAVRVIGEVTAKKLDILRKADSIFIEELKRENIYDKVWQAFAVLLPIKSVGVMGDERSYGYTVALRAVRSEDGMTADWATFEASFLKRVSARITNEVKEVTRVVYDISSKPPATIEWE